MGTHRYAVHNEATPEGRLAYAAHMLMIEMSGPKYAPDVADFRARLKPYVDRELLKAQIEEAQIGGNQSRIAQLLVKYAEVCATITEREK